MFFSFLFTSFDIAPLSINLGAKYAKHIDRVLISRPIELPSQMFSKCLSEEEVHVVSLTCCCSTLNMLYDATNKVVSSLSVALSSDGYGRD